MYIYYTCTCIFLFLFFFFFFFLQPFGEATLGKTGLVVIPVLVAFSTFGAANGTIFTSSRATFGAAKDRLLPDFLSGLHAKYRTPIPAIIFMVSALNIMCVCTPCIDGLLIVHTCIYLIFKAHIDF